MMTRWTFGLVLGAVLWPVAGAIAQRQNAPTGPQLLHSMFQDHGVLQRDRPIRVYGQTSPKADIGVTLGSANVTARAGADGRWSATLPALPAGGPYAWGGSPMCPLTDGSELPAGPFEMAIR